MRVRLGGGRQLKKIARALRDDHRGLLCGAATLGLLWVSIDHSIAQDAPSNNSEILRANALQEVVVTAARQRHEDLQTTPVAVTAISAAQLEHNHVTNFSQIGDLAPNLQINRSAYAGDVVLVYLRGFGAINSDPHAATYYDGIYIPAAAGTLYDRFNINQIEVEAGPQGTLLGRNSPIGAIYITSTKPTGTFGGTIQGDYGSYNRFGIRGKINIPLWQDATGSTILAMNTAYTQEGGGNWVYNYFNGKRDMGGLQQRTGRIGLAFTPDPSFSWDISGFVTLEDDPWIGSSPRDNVPAIPGSSSSAKQAAQFSCTLQRTAPSLVAPYLLGQGCISTPNGTTNINYLQHTKENLGFVSSTIRYALTPVTLTLVNGFIDHYEFDRNDSGGTPFVSVSDLGDKVNYDEETAEFRISSNKGGGADLNGFLDWIAGGYFSNFNFLLSNNLGVGVLAKPPFSIAPDTINSHQAERGTTQSEAAFAHVIAHFTDQWSGTFGLRQSWDQKEHAFQASLSVPYISDIPAGFHNNSLEFGTQYQFDANRMAYIRFAQGYESGGYAGLALGDIFLPETNNSYEIGVKSDWLSKKLRVNLDIFHDDISDLQLASTIPAVKPPYFLSKTLNAGSATVEGLEAQIVAIPVDDLTLRANLGYLHPKFIKNFSTTCSNAGPATDCSGIPFSYAPKWTINVAADYAAALPNDLGTLIYTADWSYRSGLYLEDPPVPASYQPGYGLVNLCLSYVDPSQKYKFDIYGTNILDEDYGTGFTDASGIGAFESYGRPAEWGIRATASF